MCFLFSCKISHVLLLCFGRSLCKISRDLAPTQSFSHPERFFVAQQVIISISEADSPWVTRDTTPVALLPQCGANYKSTSPTLYSAFSDIGYSSI